MSPAADLSNTSSPSSGWRGRLMRQTQDRQSPPKEVSRWSKTTTESELPEIFPDPPSKRRSFLKKKNLPRRQPKDSAKSSPTDPFYNPVTKQLRPFGGDIPPVITTSRPSNDQNGSDDEVDSPTSPIIQRASSVRVSRPQVVQHSNSSAGSVPKLYAQQTTPFSTTDSPNLSKLSQTLGEDLNNSLTYAVEKTEKDVIPGGRDDTLKALEGEKPTEEITALPQVPQEVSSESRDTMKETILEWPDTPSRIEALDTMPTPMGGFGSMRIPRTSAAPSYSTNASTVVADGLRANPPTETDKKLSRAISAPVRNSARRVMIRPADLVINRGNHDHKLFRENIVSTPYPARQSSIGEIDGILATQPQQDGKKTPKLRRSRPLSHDTERSEPDDETSDIADTSPSSDEKKVMVAPEIPLSTKPPPTTTAPTTSKSDRFPSPSTPEILFLDLRLSRHPSARITVEVEVTDKATFDDEQLFRSIRDSYVRKLMGRGRSWFCARRVEGASLNNELHNNLHHAGRTQFWHGQQQLTSTGDFDGADFVKHLRNPRSGRRRKMWLLWLRNNQHHESPSTAASRRGRRSYLPQPTNYSPQEEKDAKATSPVFSFSLSRNNSSGINETDSSPTKATLGIPAKQPSISLPRMPFNSPPHTQTPVHMPTSFSRSKSLAMSSSYPYPYSNSYPSPSLYPSTPSYHHAPSYTGPPTIYLHHTFSLRAIFTTTLLLILISILTMIFWILFGYPGRSAAHGDGMTTVGGQDFVLSWRRDAQSRVGVGFVVGVVVFLMGVVCEVGWVWGSWVLV